MDKYNKRFLAEWQSVGAVMLALPHENTDWAYMLESVIRCYSRILAAFNKCGVRVVLLCKDRSKAMELIDMLPSPELVVCVEAEYNDTWVRDYGPLAVKRPGGNRALDFGFNGWGLKFAADKDNLVNLHLRDKFIILPEQYRNQRDFILEGGSVESDGAGTIMTTTRCLTSPNRNGGKTKKELNPILADRLGAEHVLWLDYGSLAGDDTDSHIDTLARLAPNNIIVYTGCRNVDDEHFEELLKMRAQLTLFRNMEGDPYNLVELPMPSPVFDEDGNRLPATYANYLVTDHHLFMPVYGNKAEDTLACQTIRIAYPDHDVVGIDCRELLCQHGSLHCATMQLHNGFYNDAIWQS